MEAELPNFDLVPREGLESYRFCTPCGFFRKNLTRFFGAPSIRASTLKPFPTRFCRAQLRLDYLCWGTVPYRNSTPIGFSFHPLDSRKSQSGFKSARRFLQKESCASLGTAFALLNLCRGRDLNPHEFPHTILSRARLPIPPPRHTIHVTTNKPLFQF